MAMACLATFALGTARSFPAAQSAQVRIFCLSLRLPPATTTLAGQTYTLELGTASEGDGLNGELAPTFDPSLPSHAASFRLNDPTFLEPITGDLILDVPAANDANQNGFPDFFEVSQAVPSSLSTGLYRTDVDDGQITATWSREAGSSVGACRLQLTSRMFGDFPQFTAQFEVIEYAGALEYTPAATNVAASIDLAQTGTPTNKLAGPVQFTRSGTNRFDEIELAAGAWTNALGQTLTYTNTLVLRDTTLGTNYYTLIDFEDGNLNTAAADYFAWQLSLDDVNDADRDGIPDFSDDLPEVKPGQPTLSISSSGHQAQLGLTGEIARTYELQETPSLKELQWMTILTLTLTNRTQILDLPVAAKTVAFWRVKAQ